MPYELNAVMGSFDLLRSRTAGIRAAVVTPLRQRMALAPVTSQLLKEPTGLPTGQDGTAPGIQPRTALPPDEMIERWDEADDTRRNPLPPKNDRRVLRRRATAPGAAA